MQVCHSQRLGDPPLRPWISIKFDGEVLCAHCTCMAGVGEACSHIGATLFALETSITLLKNTTCTSMPCECIRPSAQRIEYAEGAASISSVRGASSTKSGANPSAVKEATGVRHQPRLFHLRPVRQQRIIRIACSQWFTVQCPVDCFTILRSLHSTCSHTQVATAINGCSAQR